MRSFMIVLATALMLAIPASALAGITFVPDKGTSPNAATLVTGAVHPFVLSGGLGGGTPGCGTIVSQKGDQYGNSIQASYHACWNGQSVTDNWGWSNWSQCWGFCTFNGWNQDYGFNYGHKDQGTFTDISLGVFNLRDTLTACVAVNQFGDFWECS